VLIIALTLVVKFDGEFAFACGSSPASVAALKRASDAAYDRRVHIAYGQSLMWVATGCVMAMSLRVPIKSIF
jgi:hypothetical protein